MTEVIGLGAGGHAKVIIEILRLTGEYEIAGLLDRKEELWGRSVLGVPVLGGDVKLLELRDREISHVFIGAGSVKAPETRMKLFNMAIEQGFEVVNAIHPKAIISPTAQVGRGLIMMAGAVINASALIGDNVIVNTGAVVEHDCMIGDHVHVASGAVLSGSVRVGRGSHIGAGASVSHGVRIGRSAVVATGAAVVDNVPDGVLIGGVPAKILKDSGK